MLVQALRGCCRYRKRFAFHASVVDRRRIVRRERLKGVEHVHAAAAPDLAATRFELRGRHTE